MPWVALVIAASFFANRYEVLLLHLPPAAGYAICAVLAIAGIWILALAIRACFLRVILFGRGRDRLITHGIYSYIRNPVCASCILLSFSAAFGFNSLAGIIVAIISLIAACLRALLWEERELERQFGGEYVEYRRRVGMFIPKLSSMRKRSG